MGFRKGISGNPAGRKKGTPNKTTKDIREIMNRIISSNFSETKITRDLKELSPKQRLDYLLRLAEFILPKPKSIEPEEKVIFKINLTECDSCKMPGAIELVVTKKVLDDYASGKIKKEEALKNIFLKALN